MTALGHAEAHERLADLALEPGALDRLGSPATDPLAAHVATCTACDGEVRAWRRTHAGLQAALGSGADRLDIGELASDQPVAVPAALRDAVLGAVRNLPVPAGAVAAELPPARAHAAAIEFPPRELPARRRLGIAARLLPLVAVVAIVAVGAGLLRDQALRLDRAQQEAAGLQALAVTVDRVLSDPGHRVRNG